MFEVDPAYPADLLRQYNPATGKLIRSRAELVAALRGKRHIGYTDVAWNDDKKVAVSTVHLVTDHNFGGEGPPVLWETMLFGATDAIPGDGDVEDFQVRYQSEQFAAMGHSLVVTGVTRRVQDAGYPAIVTDHPEKCYQRELSAE